MAVLLVAAFGVVATSGTAQAEPVCTIAGVCGTVVNHSGQTLQIRWFVDSTKSWHQESLDSGYSRGGGDVDVDEVYIPLGCVARVNVGGLGTKGNLKYFPGNWDKIQSNQSVEISGIDCRQDGYVYAWDGTWDDNNQPQTSCRWFNDDPNWGDDCGNFRNWAGSLQNNSSHGNAVNFYYHPNYTGAWACLGPGDVWRDARYNYFSWGAGQDGYSQAIYKQIASSKWVRTCG
ncbi:hypothetical protein ABZ890_43190 [Streptomyces sp. NPDC046984]|uniref:hypothetical protein n=1 Tax=Streptomyces sp. NPDC046984 TaxID=3155138 RepID=UPI0033EE678A